MLARIGDGAVVLASTSQSRSAVAGAKLSSGTTFLATAEAYGLPQSTRTDNGFGLHLPVYGGRNGFEYLLASLGITQKNGHPSHPPKV